MTMAEFWMQRYEIVIAEKRALGKKLRETLEENKDLQQQLDKLKNRLTYTALKNMEANIEDLQQKINGLRISKDVISSVNSGLARQLSSFRHQNQELKMQLEAEKKENESLHNVIDSFVDKCKELEDKAKGYKKERDEKIELLNAVQDRFTKAELEAKLEDMTQRCENIRLSLRIVNERLDKSIADRKELQADRDFWVHDSAEKTVEIQSLKNDLEKSNSDRDAYHGLYTELRKDYDRLFEEVRALKIPGCRSLEELRKDLDDAKKQLKYFTNSIDEWRDRAKHAEKEAEEVKQVIKERYSDGYSDGNEEGQKDLWEMLQLINDVKPFEAPYFEDVTSMNDIISWDLEDFKEAYDKWEAEQKKAAEEAKKQHTEYMRDYLKRYCRGRLCINCPLHDISPSVTSCLFSKLTDEEVEKRYKKAVESERSKKTPTPMSARLPQPWECTIEPKVEINEDILKVVCGIKPDEEDHEFVYGDAVRIPWCDYDYMYIGPEPEATETQVRLFDPKNHTVVVTFATNVTYNGGKVILTREGEDDLKKIWKDKK